MASANTAPPAPSVDGNNVSAPPLPSAVLKKEDTITAQAEVDLANAVMDLPGLDEIDLGDGMKTSTKDEESAIDDVRIAMAGSVDAGKSSLIGVLISGKYDDGRGSARNLVAKHRHEIDDGRTSDINSKRIHFKDGHSATLIDLCGHRKYLGNTIWGMTGWFPHYAMVMVSPHRGVLGITQQHIAILTLLNIPIVIVITKVDNSPKDAYDQAVKQINRLLKNPLINKRPVWINTRTEIDLWNESLIECEDKAEQEKRRSTAEEKLTELREVSRGKILTAAAELRKSSDRIPIISISNVSGFYIDEVRQLFNSLRLRPLPEVSSGFEGSVFYINTVFQKAGGDSGAGLVVSGSLFGQPVNVSTKMFLGPFNKEYVPVNVWSIHGADHNSLPTLENTDGCFAIKFTNKKQAEMYRKRITKGMVVISSLDLTKHSCLQFNADVEVLHHKTSIRSGYMPQIHCGPVTQTVRMSIPPETQEDGTVKPRELMTGDKANVTFRFANHEAFIKKGMRIFFRGGRTEGYGIVTDVLPSSEDPRPPALTSKNRRWARNRGRGRGRGQDQQGGAKRTNRRIKQLVRSSGKSLDVI